MILALGGGFYAGVAVSVAVWFYMQDQPFDEPTRRWRVIAALVAGGAWLWWLAMVTGHVISDEVQARRHRNNDADRGDSQ